MRREILGILVALLGVNLWMVLCLSPLQIEWMSQDAQPLALVVYTLPLLLLTVGALTRWASLLLFLLPSSLLLVWFLLPDLDRAVYTQPSGWLPLGGSLVLYTLTAALWSNTRPPKPTTRRNPYAHLLQTPPTPPERPTPPGHTIQSKLSPNASSWFSLWRPYQGHFFPRFITLILLFILPIYAANFSPTTPSLYNVGFETQADQAQVMINLAFLFVWVVVAYLFFIAPGLNLELEQRTLDRTLDTYARRTQTRRPLSWVIVLGTFVLVTLLLGISSSLNLLPSLF